MFDNRVDILLAEDNPTDLELALRVLRRQGIADRVVAVRDGQEALDFLFASGGYAKRDGAEPPRLVLLDIKMPKLSGLEVLRRLREDERTRDVPVVMLSSSQEERDLRESERLGANSYVVKPVEYSEFAETLATIGRYWLQMHRRS